MSTLTFSASLLSNSNDIRNAVATAKERVASNDKFRNKLAAIIGGSLLAHLGAFAILTSMPIEQMNASMDLSAQESVMNKTNAVAQLDKVEEEQPKDETGETGDNTGAGNIAMALESGAAGNPDTKTDGGLHIKNINKPAAIAKAEAMEYARTAGILGSQLLNSEIRSVAGTEEYSSGFDTASYYGPIFGADGPGHGEWGMGRDGHGPGGGCPYGMSECGSVPGNSKYKTISNGPGAGDGPWGPGTGGGRLRKHVVDVPNPVGPPRDVTDGLDKAIIKRYVKQQTFKISYCYEHELISRNDLAGEVMVNFLITPSGTVQVSTGTGFDGAVSSCVANVVKSIKFPSPKNGGNVQVNYPFSFRKAA